MNGHSSIQHEYSSLPSTFISSLRQLFSILDQNKSGYVPFVVFKRYFDPSSSAIDFLHELEIESQSNENFITFPLLIHVIERAISTPPTILIPKPTRPVHRSTSTLLPSEIDFPMV